MPFGLCLWDDGLWCECNFVNSCLSLVCRVSPPKLLQIYIKYVKRPNKYNIYVWKLKIFDLRRLNFEMDKLSIHEEKTRQNARKWS